MRIDDILATASLAGKVMLESGGEISRVEQTVVHLSGIMGAQACEAFATPTTVILSATMADGQVSSVVRRITQRETRLDRVEAVNKISRSATPGDDPAALRSALEAAARKPAYPPLLRVLAAGAGAGAFALFFGGGAAEALCAFLGGLLVRVGLQALAHLQPNLFVANLAGGAGAALCGLAGHLLGVTNGWQAVTVAVLMLMVPGVAVTNALRDIAAGELLAGISRTVEAFCIAAALACGSALVYALAGWLGGVAL